MTGQALSILCATCGGRNEPCAACNGERCIVMWSTEDFESFICKDCGGFLSEDCSSCNGTGWSGKKSKYDPDVFATEEVEMPLIPCKHGGGSAYNCTTCQGSGFVVPKGGHKMAASNVVLAPCEHGSWSNSNCNTCKGSGYVKVIPGPDGQPVECKHGSWSISNCKTCGGSGWAGMVWD